MERSSKTLPKSTPIEQRMDPALFTEAETAAVHLPNLYAFLVLRNGYLVHEYYAPGKTNTTKYHIRSITKSILSALVGIALDRGIIDRTDRRIVDYLPEVQIEPADPKRNEISLEHLLTMTSGLSWDESSEEAVSDWFFSGKRAAIVDVLKRPVAHEPGTHFNYDSPAADLLASILALALQRDLRSFAIDALFDPLDIHDFEWEKDPVGFYRGSAGLVMRPIDVAKVGQLYLQNGRWQGQQIVSAEWVKQSVSTQAAVNEAYGYGRLWWIKEKEPPRFYSAVGYGGQFILVAPQQQLVVVASHEWWEISGDVAGKQSTDFHESVFTKVLASAT